MGPALEAVDHEGEARRTLGEVGRVDLRDVAHADHLGAGAGARDQGLHLLGREVLRLVDDEELVEESAAAHEVQALDLDAAADEVAGGRATPVAALAGGAVEHVEVVLERAHPGCHLFFLGAGQEADVLAHRNGDAGHDDLAVALRLQHLGEPGGERQQGLAGAGLAEQGDEVDLGVHQQVEREVLLAVARGDAPDVVLVVAVVGEGLDEGAAAFLFLHPGLQRVVAVLIDELVDQHLGGERPADAVVAAAFFLPRLHAARVAVPEVGGQLAGAGVQQVAVLEHLVVEVVLRGEPERTGLDAHVDVLRHQDDLAPGVLLHQEHHHREDLVVAARGRQGRRQLDVDRLGLQVQASGGLAARGALERDARGNAVFRGAYDLVEHAAGLAGVACHLAGALLVVVEFLQRHDRHVEVVLLEAVQAGRVVHQHVGVEHEELARCRGLAGTADTLDGRLARVRGEGRGGGGFAEGGHDVDPGGRQDGRRKRRGGAGAPSVRDGSRCAAGAARIRARARRRALPRRGRAPSRHAIRARSRPRRR
ncbi:dehydrogenase [Thauera aminoaromatica S2]|uniref:Dehydrogenase n=1 Tax=Thauera aminoaromatica S2 TaxID=1234381 RepID=N6YVV1_THASP|nr:dehydrogenase [Thauera aminoaromatica S2]